MKCSAFFIYVLPFAIDEQNNSLKQIIKPAYSEMWCPITCVASNTWLLLLIYKILLYVSYSPHNKILDLKYNSGYYCTAFA